MIRCLAILLLLPFLLHADELRFRDGSVVVGNFISVESGFYVFDSPLLGRIYVNTADAELVRGEAPVGMPISPIVQFRLPEPAVAIPVTEPIPTVITAPSEQPVQQRQAASDEAAIAEAKEVSLLYRVLASVNPLKGWKSRISVGYSLESSNVRTEDVTVLFNAERKGPGSDFKFNVRYDYGKQRQESQPSTILRDRFRSSLRYREDFSARFFFQTESDYHWDNIRGIEHDFRQNIGAGWRFIKTDRTSASLIPLATVRFQQMATHTEGWDFLFTLSQDFRLKVNERMTFIQSVSASWDADDLGRSGYQLSFRLENRLTDRIFMDLVYETNFDYAVGAGFNPRSQRTNVLVGYQF